MYSTNWIIETIRPAAMKPTNSLAVFGIFSVRTGSPRDSWTSPPPSRSAARIEPSRNEIPARSMPSPRNCRPWVQAWAACWVPSSIPLAQMSEVTKPAATIM